MMTNQLYLTLIAAYCLIFVLASDSIRLCYGEEPDGLAVKADPEIELEQARRRFSLVWDARSEWIIESSNDAAFLDQERQRIKHFEVEHALRLFADRKDQQKGGFAPLTPIIFGSRLDSLWPPLLEGWGGFITKSHYTQLCERIERRRQHLQDGFTGRIINLIDEEIYLSGQQRRSIESTITKPQRLNDALFSLNAYANQFGLRSTHELTAGISSLLTESQKNRLQSLVEKKHILHILPARNENQTSEDFSAALRNHIWDRNKPLRESLSLQHELFCSVNGITPEEIRKIELAMLGTVQRYNHRQFETVWAQRGDIESDFYIYAPNFAEIEREPIWEQVRLKMVLHPDMIERSACIRESHLHYVMALLDQELWFRSLQYAKVFRLVSQTLPDVISLHEETIFRPLYSDQQLLASALHCTSDVEIESILTTSQMKAWRALKLQFDVKDNEVFIEGRHERINVGSLLKR